jgi:peptidase A24-like protein
MSFSVLMIALLYGYLADHIYTVWRIGGMPKEAWSRCDGCGGHLTWEMTPILGYLATRGRCWRSGCELIVPPTYPFVEIVGVLVGIVAASIALRASSVPAFLVSFIGGFAIAYAVGFVCALILNRIASPRGQASK